MFTYIFIYLYTHTNTQTRIKVRAIENKRYMRLEPAGVARGFFGWCVYLLIYLCQSYLM